MVLSTIKNKLPCIKNKADEHDDLGNLTKQYETEAHMLPKEKIIQIYQTDFKNGLSDEVVKEKEAQFGKNLLTPPKETHVMIKFLLKLFTDIFNLLLILGGVGCLISFAIDSTTFDNIILAIALFVVVLITTIFGTYQEYSTGQKMKAFKNFLPQKVNVIRNSELVELLASDIFPGDIVALKAGDKVPSDLLVIECSHDAKVDNSSITGESEPQTRSPEMTSKEPLETQNIVFFGTLIVQGNAKCMVIKTGDETLLGNIAKLTTRTTSEKTPIGREITHFVKIISVIAFILGFGIGIANGFQTKDTVRTLVLIIGLIVANVPEGLLITVTISLTLAAHRMSKKSVLIKNLECVETLGSTSIICSDKTGTLTINRMTVSHLFYDGRARTIDTHDQRKGDFDKNEEGFTRFMRAAILCNNATYNKENMIIGDASESGLLKFGNPNLNDTIAEFRRKRQKLHGIPFNSKNKWQLSIHRTSEDSSKGPVIVMKGAPERVLQYCDRILLDEQVKPLRQEDIDSIMHGLNSFATQGERVLGFCELELDGEAFPEDYKFQGDSPDEANFPFRSEKNQSEGFVFLGLSAMIDPPRPSVPQSVLKCQSAGISVFMVTGDHPTTARAIASKVNIIAPKDSVFDLSKIEKPTLEDIESSDSTACVVTGSHITLFTNDVSADSKVRFWNGILSHKHIVFSRTSPQQKLLIVESCQKRNGIVAVTGDGVNDSPALKKADIGIAMGVAGTDVAKEAANMILMDDNFSSIVNGVEEGRVLFDNLKKSIAYTLSSNIPEIFPVIFKLLIGIPLPIQTIHILIIDLGTDMIPAISMAYEKKEADIMKQPPRNPKTERLVTKSLVSFSYLLVGIFQMLAGMFTYFVVYLFAGFELKQVINLDRNDQFLNCDVADKYLTCSTAKDFSGNYCIYSANPLATRLAKYTVFNMDCNQREIVSDTANASYVLSIIIVQVADVMISKTRRNSVFLQGMGNLIMNIGIAIEFLAISFLIYTPKVNRALSFNNVSVLFWVPPLPFFMGIFGLDEMRKLLIRKDFNGWVKRNTYW